ncbi:malate synthase A [Qingshengfaniella alkalisoli]|uniref:Malate synthase n=1 Tax=Qingshengfaniella alkalisoli TaxID=2599296 RepID=A0A5B8JAK4_9RHOB|nr:malate synthase A [Qingshengfaniella alkalisoli]QDY71210.1 malate synthase A [Qingshengfaniella alkalisoli]
MSLDLAPPTNATRPIILRAVAGQGRVLTPDALAFLAELQSRFGSKLHALMVARERRQERIDAGRLPDYLEDTKSIRQGIWSAAPVPPVLSDRRVEITGAVDRKMMIAALNSGAKVFMADFEDATAPSFSNIIAGHANMLDHRDGTLEHEDSETGQTHRLNSDPALIFVRPRGLHMTEANVMIGGHPMSAALFDLGLNIFHNGRALAVTGRGPFYYLPKIESHREARFWNEVFCFAQDRIGLSHGSIKATVLIETLPAAFEMDEIVWELRDHICGLNCGRWDYVFSYIKTLRNHPEFILPDRQQITMDRAFLATHLARLVKVCHRRGIHAIGSMATQMPVTDADKNACIFAKVREDKLREARAGYDGTWVAHPDLVATALEAFASEMSGPNQVNVQRQHHRIEPVMLLQPHQGEVTEEGLKTNIRIGIEYLGQWLTGHGTVSINDLWEDAATAEISRAQVWQWIHHRVEIQMQDGTTRTMSADWLNQLVQAEIERIIDQLGPNGFCRGRYASAARIFQEAATADVLPDFMTTPAYDVLNAID